MQWILYHICYFSQMSSSKNHWFGCQESLFSGITLIPGTILYSLNISVCHLDLILVKLNSSADIVAYIFTRPMLIVTVGLTLMLQVTSALEGSCVRALINLYILDDLRLPGDTQFGWTVAKMIVYAKAVHNPHFSPCTQTCTIVYFSLCV